MKILAFTGIRSDYDVMSSLYRKLHNCKSVDLQLVVSGTHLSKAHGYSIKQIYDDKFNIIAKIKSLPDFDTKATRVKSAAELFAKSIDVVEHYKPDLILYAGDREDVIVAGIIAVYLAIPSIHCYAGDHGTSGHVDNPIRHATSKLASAHFVTMEEHKMRLVSMGEARKRIFVTGNFALDNFKHFEPFGVDRIENQLNAPSLRDGFALLIYHPAPDELGELETNYRNILDALASKKIKTFVGYPNSDEGNSRIINVFEDYQDNSNFIFYKNLDRELFLSIYKRSKFIIGNSSSGICEAASIPIPAINIGTRQENRHAGLNVISCRASKNDICLAIEKATNNCFLEEVKRMENPYGHGDSSQLAFDIIMGTNFDELLLKTEDPIKEN
jgi:UDP-hydrolysing UDP-N-acetyl-D-glucosamine 2-epimerase